MNMPKTKISEQPEYSGREKRAAARLFITAGCSLVFEDSHEIATQLTNVSFSGAFVSFPHDDTEAFLNQRVWIEFTLMIKNKPYPLRVSGMIVRAVPNGVGIAFRLSERNRIAPIVERMGEGIEEAKRCFTGNYNSY